jgi:hypothetical protein
MSFGDYYINSQRRAFARNVDYLLIDFQVYSWNPVNLQFSGILPTVFKCLAKEIF